MSLLFRYSRAARPAAAGILALIAAAVIAALLGDALPDSGGQTAAVTAGWAVSALAAACLAASSRGLRAEAVMWVLALIGAAVAYGGLEGPAFSRPLTLLASGIAFVMAVVVTLLQADDSVATPSDRF